MFELQIASRSLRDASDRRGYSRPARAPRTRTAAERRRALQALSGLMTQADIATPPVLLTADGRRLGDARLETPGDATRMLDDIRELENSADSAHVGRLYSSGGHASFWLTVAVRHNRELLGYLIQERRMNSNPRALGPFRDVMGTDIDLFLHNAKDDRLWVSITGAPVPAPIKADRSSAASTCMRTDRGGDALASTSVIRGTPLVDHARGADGVDPRAPAGDDPHAHRVRDSARRTRRRARVGSEPPAHAAARRADRARRKASRSDSTRSASLPAAATKSGDWVACSIAWRNKCNDRRTSRGKPSSGSRSPSPRNSSSPKRARFSRARCRIRRCSPSSLDTVRRRSADYCTIHIADDDGMIRRVETVHHDPNKRELVRALVKRYEDRVDGPGPVPNVIRSQQPVLVPRLDLSSLQRTAPDEAAARLLWDVGPTSFMCVPLVARGRGFGAMSFTITDSGRTFGQDDVDLAMELSRRTAVAIDNAVIYRRSIALRLEAEAASNAKSDFLAKMSHEIRTPINAMLGYAELLEMGISGPVTEAQAKHLGRIRVSGEHLTSLVNEMLDLAKIEAGRMTVEPVHAVSGDAAEAAVALIRPQAVAKGVEISAALEGNPRAEYIGDPQRVQQILMNLLSNAVKFTAAGGSVTVRCASESGRGEWRPRRRRGLDVDHGAGHAASESPAMISTGYFIPSSKSRTAIRACTAEPDSALRSAEVLRR